jgi:predicted transposase/invertase (TIGR01784 family)
LKKAQHYTSLEHIIALTITDFEMFEDFEKVMSYWNLREKDDFIKYSDDIELIFVELPKFTKTEAELQTITEKWIYFIKHAGELDFIPTTFTEPHLREAFEKANTAGLDEDELELQFKRRDFIYFQKSAVEKARNEGREEEKVMIAKNSLQQGLGTHMIASITGLRLEEIEQLQKTLNVTS